MPAPSSTEASRDGVETRTVRLTFPPRPELVSLARLVAGALAERHGVEVDTVEAIRLVVSEACTNAVRAQMAREVPAPIVLDCVLNGDFRIEITDQGGGISPELAEHSMPNPTTTDWPEESTGFGIPIMRRLADQAHFAVNESGGTTVVLTLRT